MGNPLKDLGLSEGEHMSVEHALAISLSTSLETQLLRTLNSFTETSRETSKAIKIIGYALATYLVLLGVSKVIEAAKNSSAIDSTEENAKRG